MDRAFAQPGGEFEILAALDHICFEAPDLRLRRFTASPDELDLVTPGFVDECSKEIALVPRGLTSQGEAHSKIRSLAIRLLSSADAPLSEVLRSIERLNDPRVRTTLWLVRLMEDDYALLLLDLARTFVPSDTGGGR